ncbi:helix-turn-helix domain-containing protein [Paracoccus aestuariivivens]|uniref:Helix-turn-helix domain-containing protein n=1 Tax=Paracoccus aestuariivivens TaxID=1820333 RepID=A0A6L6J6T6_9RHOB|nr:helix-turn-helix domain-containing protein [Paracoccus aestuariivivens]MTH76918.1 helix-turn-helix domain-containing protein [Paracoccus aestuariivivens]
MSVSQISAPSVPHSVEAQLFVGSLLRNEWTFRGRRNRIFVLVSGSGSIRLGQYSVMLDAPSITFVPAGETGSILFEAGAEGGALSADDTILASAMPNGALFVPVRDAIARPIIGAGIGKPEASRLTAMLTSIEAELRNHAPGAHEVVRHHLALLLIEVWRLATSLNHISRPTPRSVVRGFAHLVELHARQHWSVADYARLLGVSPDRLNTAIRRATGRSPMEFINQRLAAEAIRLLDQTALQISEIAETLGFGDPAYFSRFFKRMTGLSPRAHRMGALSRRPNATTSYAAWP